MSVPSFSTNAAVAAADISGITHIVGLQIVIDAEVFTHFESFQLQQTITGHHRFRLSLQHDILPAAQDHTLEDARRFLGRRISVTFRYKSIPSGSPEREFIGIITSVGFNGEHGSRGSIVLTGESPTALLDGAAHTQSFGGDQPTSLGTIADAVIKQAIGESRFDVSVKPSYTANLPYSCQYNETHYNYLCRMAAAYGEWFFYDGTILHFGKPVTADPIKLIYGKDTDRVELRMNAVHTGIQHYGYNSSSNKSLTTGDMPPEGLGESGMYAVDAGSKVFKAPALSIAPVRAVTDKDIEATQKSSIGAAASEAFMLTGSTSVPFLYPGCLIEMNFRRPESAEVSYFSRLLITSVNHSVDSLGNYRGNYEAIPSDTPFLPAPAFRMPQPQPQTATVISNANSEGRVKVQFDWQRGSDNTDFIRVATPDGGGTGNVPQNRGFAFIPEEGDQVMVGFVHGHPDRPFVQSALFHGGNGLGGFDTNHMKSIKTRSGVSIQIDDTDGKGSITVSDPSGNVVYLDGAGNININAPKNINITAGENVNIQAGLNINASAAMNINESAGVNKILTVGAVMNTHIGSNHFLNVSGDSIEVIKGDFKSETKERTETTKKGYNIQSSEDSVHIKASEEIQKHSGEKSKNS